MEYDNAGERPEFAALDVYNPDGAPPRPYRQHLRWLARRPEAWPDPSQPPALAPDIAFLLGKGPSFSALWRATERAKLLGLPARRCLIASGAISEIAYVRAFGERLDAPVVENARVNARVCLDEALAQGWCRAVLVDGAEVLLVTPTSVVADALLTGRLVSPAGCLAVITVANFRATLVRAFGTGIAQRASQSVSDPESARDGMTQAQRRYVVAAFCALVLAILLVPRVAVTFVPFALGWLFLGAACVQLGACFAGQEQRLAQPAAADRDLPDYSVLVPLYRETAVVNQLVTALEQIDYPGEKLQVIIVVEQQDLETQRALTTLKLPAHITVFVAPPGEPRTKPRALNAAMPFVTGEFVVVYDAEDRPDPLQLRKAVEIFRRSARNVACLQARLSIDNTADSILTRLFTIEYAALFDITKAGTARLGLPVPLGGTSNHFRTDILRELGLWDAWNVTEDADLGLRLARHGYRVEDLDSTTEEEAPAALDAWMAQRTRWLKGWMQTVVTHSRHPVATWRGMGTGNFLAAVSVSAGVVVGAMFAPLFQIMAVVRALSPGFLEGHTPLEAIADGLVVVLGIAGLLTVYVPAFLALYRKRLWSLMPWLPLLPAYHLLVSAASWRAAYELATAPHRWNKTRHGLARSSRMAGRAQKQ